MINEISVYLMEQLKTNQFFSAAFIGSLITGGFIYLKFIPNFLYDKILRKIGYSVTIYEYDELFDLVEKWMTLNNPKTYRNVEAYTGDNNDNMVLSSKSDTIINKLNLKFKQETINIWVRYKNRYIKITKHKEKLERVESKKNVFFARIIFWGIFSEKEIKEILSESLKLKEYPKDEIFVNTWDAGWGEWRKNYFVKPKPFKDVILNKDLKDSIISDINNFIISKEWYDDRFIKFKRGYCFHGKPGNGKSSLSMAIANELNWNYNVINLSNISSDHNLISAFRQLKEKTVLTIEDIDGTFNGREVISKLGNELSFSTILNCFDGMLMPDNIILIITTNHIEKLDSALIRSGRIDKIFEIKNPTKIEIEEYVNIFFNCDIKLKNYEKYFCMADIQNICLENKDDLNNVLNIIEN